jgi:nucleoid-associated protein YgaU
MRTEAKFAVVVVLVAVIGSALYFFSRNNEKPIDLTSPKTPPHAAAPKVEEMPLPLGPGAATITEKPKESEVTVTPVPEVTEIAPKADQSKPVLKIDLNPLGSTPTTRPGKTSRGKSGRMAKGTSSEMLVPNQPAKLDLTPSAEITSSSTSPAGQEPTTAQVHIVKPGETLYVIAKKYYGRGEMWTVIARANKELHPGSLHAGAKLTIPPAGKAKEHFDGPSTAKAEDLPKTVDKSKVKTYTIKSGDSFSSIAREHLGSKSRWKEIFELNKAKISKPQNLRVGQTIYLPEK